MERARSAPPQPLGGFGERILRRSVAARDREALLRQMAWAKERLGLGPEAHVVSCYEAGRGASGCTASSRPTGSRT